MSGRSVAHREGYKETELGWIPEDWEVVKLGEVVKFSGGAQPPRKIFVFKPREGYLRLIQIRDYKTDRFQTYIPKELARKLCNEDDIMIGRYGPPIFQILKGIKGAYNVALIKAIPDKKLLKNYLWYFLIQRKLFLFIENLSQRSSGQTGVDLEKLRFYDFPLPPLPEQQKIAAILSTVDEKIASIDTEINGIQQLKKGLMRQLFTRGIGHTEFKETKIGKIPKEWDCINLNNIAIITMGQSPPGDTYNQDKIGVPILNGPTEFTNKYPIPIQYTTKVTKMSLKNDILFCVRGSSTGRMNIADQNYCIGRGLASIRQKNNSNTLFIYYTLLCIVQEIFSEAKGAGSTFPNISGNDLGAKLIPLPPLPEQQKIADILSTVDAKLDILREKKEGYQTLKKGLMQQLLTGAVRVRLDVPGV